MPNGSIASHAAPTDAGARFPITATFVSRQSISMPQRGVDFLVSHGLPIEDHDAVEWPATAVMGDKLEEIAFRWFSFADRAVENNMKYAGRLIEAAFDISTWFMRRDRIMCHQMSPDDPAPPNPDGFDVFPEVLIKSVRLKIAGCQSY